MQHYGRRTVRMKFDGARGHGAATFEVTDVEHPILSVGALMRSGHVLVLSPTEPYLLRPTGEMLALEMRNGLPYVKVEVVESGTAASQPWIPWKTPAAMRGQPPRQQEEINEAGPEPPLRAQMPTIQEITDASPACEGKEPEGNGITVATCSLDRVLKTQMVLPRLCRVLPSPQ